jgi:hypothetical protein
LKEWTTPDSRNTPSTTNLEEKEIVEAPGNDGKSSMPEQVKRPNPWGKMMMLMMMMMIKRVVFIPNVKITNTSQGHIHKYQNPKRKLYNCNANIYFNKLGIKTTRFNKGYKLSYV